MGMVKVNPICLHFFIFTIFVIFSFITKSEGADCVYNINVKTGSEDNAGTDSKMSLTLSDAKGNTVTTDDLAGWGGNTETNYFENGNLDNFHGYLKCNLTEVCAITITSDGTGGKPGWYCDFIEVTACAPSGSNCSHQRFDIYRWLAVDEYPHSLTASRDYCNSNN